MPSEAPCTCGCPNIMSPREVEADLERYRRRGPDRTTQSLIDAITAQGVEGATLLDIGSGIGAIQLALLGAGVARAQSIDATEAYMEVAKAEADRLGYADRTSVMAGDFVELAPEIEAADVVTLDRVVCCYPDLAGLLGHAAAHALRMLGLVYPRDTWWNRLAGWVLDAASWVRRDPTRAYVHRTRDIDAILRTAGYRRRDVGQTLVWQVALYVREPVAG